MEINWEQSGCQHVWQLWISLSDPKLHNFHDGDCRARLLEGNLSEIGSSKDVAIAYDPKTQPRPVLDISQLISTAAPKGVGVSTDFSCSIPVVNPIVDLSFGDR